MLRFVAVPFEMTPHGTLRGPGELIDEKNLKCSPLQKEVLLDKP
jgi:hypothetical protein